MSLSRRSRRAANTTRAPIFPPSPHGRPVMQQVPSMDSMADNQARADLGEKPMARDQASPDLVLVPHYQLRPPEIHS